MSSVEVPSISYPHPENLSRPEAMRHETGPVMTLAAMYVLREVERELDEGLIEPSESKADESLHNATDWLINQLGRVSTEVTYDLRTRIFRDPENYKATCKRAMYYTFFGEGGRSSIVEHLLDGFGPQLDLTKQLLLPGYLHSKYSHIDSPPSFTSLSQSEIIDTLESPDFQKLLIFVTKTGNGLWRSGIKAEYAVPFLRPTQTINAKNLCVQTKDGRIIPNPSIRKLLSDYLQYLNTERDEQVQPYIDRGLPIPPAYESSSIGCPVSVRKGNFPFSCIPVTTLVEQFSATIDEDGSIVVPDIMNIDSEGIYTYINPSPAILATNNLLIKALRHLYPKTDEV